MDMEKELVGVDRQTDRIPEDVADRQIAYTDVRFVVSCLMACGAGWSPWSYGQTAMVKAILRRGQEDRARIPSVCTETSEVRSG